VDRGKFRNPYRGILMMKKYIMKKATLGIIITGFLISGSCKNPNPHPGGTITFKSATYDVRECHNTGDIVYAVFGASDTSSGVISCIFDSSSLPLISGTYTTGRIPNSNRGLIIYMISPGARTNYVSTGGNGTEKINVTVEKNIISLSCSGIEMASQTNDGDSAAMNLNITQTK
jgi:hypothetical protein